MGENPGTLLSRHEAERVRKKAGPGPRPKRKKG
jgi:hypothetical protein